MQHFIQDFRRFSRQAQAGAAGVEFRRARFGGAAGGDGHVFQQFPANNGVVFLPKTAGVFLYQARITESKNKNLDKPYQAMKDKYQGAKMKLELIRHFELFEKHLGFGFNYEINEGTLFGFETGHRFGLKLNLL